MEEITSTCRYPLMINAICQTLSVYTKVCTYMSRLAVD